MPNILNLKEKENKEQEDNKVQMQDQNSSSKNVMKKEKKQVKKPDSVEYGTKIHLEWTTPEFEYHNKSKNWFIITGIIAGILFLIAIFTKNFLFGLLIGISYFLITTYSMKKPDDIKVSIIPKGIKINKALYDFDNLRSFWIFYDPPKIRELSLRSKKMVMPYIKIPLGGQNPVEVRKVLIKYLPEKKHKESTIDNLARNLKF